MTWNELREMMEGLPKNWEFSRHEVNALFRIAEGMPLDVADKRITSFIGHYESRFKPSAKRLAHALMHDANEGERDATATPPPEPGDWVEVDAQYSEREYHGRHWGKVIPHAESCAAFHLYGAYLAAKSPVERREAIKAYYEARDALNAPIEGKEAEGIRALLERCDSQIEHEKACVSEPAESEPQDDSEADFAATLGAGDDIPW